jgi:hypothetical protein
VGGTSYGTYQIAAKVGTFDAFLNYLHKEDPALADRLSKAGPADSGSTGGKVAQEWKTIAKEQPERFAQLQHGFIQATHYDPAAERIKDRTGLDVDSQPLALRQVLWSTATAHGSRGASNIFETAVRQVGTKDLSKLVSTIYELRKTKYGAQPESIQNAMVKRYDQESKIALTSLKG